MKFVMLRSKRVAMRRQSLSRQNMRSALLVDGFVVVILDLAVFARRDDGLGAALGYVCEQCPAFNDHITVPITITAKVPAA
jgi:hypothetical protein